jgi:uncharacterized membrane protein YraQ (UPF0718 family)
LPAEVIFGIVVVAILGRGAIRSVLDGPAVQTWFTVFVSITVQAMPFLVLGVVLSGAIAAFVPPGALARALPRRSALAVPVAGLAGVALPGCECSSVPIAGRLVARGAKPAAALTFLLAAPAINPVVIVATAVAFPGRPEMAVARFGASLLAAVCVGLVWIRIGRDEWVARARQRSVEGDSRWSTFAATAAHDFLHAGGFLVLGGITAATLQVIVPRSILDSLAGSGVVAVATMALLAVVLAICSEADAFVAAGLSQFSLTSRLVFLVVGPMVDLKLIALQSGVFGRAFAIRFAPLAFAAAVGSALLVGWWLL